MIHINKAKDSGKKFFWIIIGITSSILLFVFIMIIISVVTKKKNEGLKEKVSSISFAIAEEDALARHVIEKPDQDDDDDKLK